MGTRDARFDAYIDKAAPFARPILEHLREVVHAACPDVEEAIKWRSPHFLYKGMLCHMAAFKEHCAFGFWKGSMVVDQGESAEQAMGQFGRFTSVADLPSKKVLSGYIKTAMKLNGDGVKSPARKRTPPRKEPAVPAVLAAALARNKAAASTFAGFSPSRRREYIEWINEAKTDDTRSRRLATAIEWLAEGKPRHWKYLSC